jgi:EAL domain-containing protein (putative c-di-GMP-specific phosphodiesterase class I)
LQRLRVLGCDLVQGNRIGAASPADELARRLSLRRSAGMQTDQTG